MAVRYTRGTTEFDRFAFFTDAVFAIAMTLLVVGIGIPKLADPAALSNELRDLWPEILSFFVSFAVIGFYWRGSHSFVSNLEAVDQGLLTLNLPYLAAIAFVPFPTALVGIYDDQPEAVVIYALTLAVASAVDTLMFVWSHARRLLRFQLTRAGYVHYLAASLAPVVVFLVSIPIALVSPTAALWSWLSIWLIESILGRLEPASSRVERQVGSPS